jgi:formimidoylglutamate deiminase
MLDIKKTENRNMTTGKITERDRGEGLKYFQFKSLLQQNGWLSPAYVGIDESGTIQYLSSEAPQEPAAVEFVNGLALPGFQNAHSHAFQYAMAGLAENHASGTDDDFWTWREEMYKCALSVDPTQAEAIATMLYAEMVRHGYTHVAEFHYLHHDKDGKPYNNLAEMGERMVAAAKTAGIKITLVPVFYQKGGFGQDPQPRQKRFISKTVDEYFHLLDDSANVVKNQSHARLGFSVHSLRAVNLEDIITTFNQGPKSLPFHLHVAEQKKEIEDCLGFIKKRPMQWLLEKLPVNERFHLVHSTHLDDDELKRLAASKANVVLCPSTEGNLGDGIFRMKEYVKLGGHWCIGTDSHIGLNPFEEFRMIDYRQRLVTNKRNTIGGDAAQYFVDESVQQGRTAMGRMEPEHFKIGQSFDALIINAGTHLLADTSEKNRMASIVYTSDSSRNLGTIVNGNWVVKNQHHQAGHEIKTAFSKAMKELRNR